MKHVTIALLAATAFAATPAAAQTWEELAGSGTGGGITGTSSTTRVFNSSVAMDADGNPVVAWTQSPATNESTRLFARAYDPAANGGQGAWVALGPVPAAGNNGITESTGPIQSLALILDGSGAPVVAWSSEAQHIYVKAWRDGAWVPHSTGSASGNGISGLSKAGVPSMALDAAGNPVVTWNDTSTSVPNGNGVFIVGKVYAARYDSGTSTWATLERGAAGAGISLTQDPNSAQFPHVTAGLNGSLIFSWVESSRVDSLNRMYVLKYAQGTWTPLWTQDEGILAKLPSVSMSVVADDSSVYVAWSDTNTGNTTSVARYNGQVWTPLGSTFGLGITDADSPSLELAVPGKPVIAFRRLVGSTGTGAISRKYDIFALRWAGQSWEPIDRGTGNVSNRDAQAEKPTLLSNREGTFFAAWTQGVSGKFDVCGRRSRNTRPLASELEQRKAGGAVIDPGAQTTTFGARLRGTDPDGPSTLTLEVEIRPVGSAFLDQATASAAPLTGDTGDMALSLAVTTLERNIDYHWQARVVDGLGGVSPWISFGSQPDDPGETDFRLVDNLDPAASAFRMLSPLTGEELAGGGACFTRGTMSFLAQLTDPERNLVRLEVEVRPVGVPFDGSPTGSGDWVDDGETTTVISTVGTGPQHVAFRALDAEGGMTDWIAAGGNGEDSPDFTAMSDGSAGLAQAACASSGAAGMALVAAGILLAGTLLRPGLPH